MPKSPEPVASPSRRHVLAGAAALLATPARAATASPAWPAKLLAAAEAQVGVTLAYDPAYARLAYPGGDVPRDKGVCTDVIIRAYRDAFGTDLQRLIHEDMAAHFVAYPRRGGMAATDANIDHRRVLNLQVFFKRFGATLPLTQNAADYQAGDVVTSLLPGNLPHIMLVRAAPQVIHNIGGGARIEDRLFEFPLRGHFRYAPAA